MISACMRVLSDEEIADLAAQASAGLAGPPAPLLPPALALSAGPDPFRAATVLRLVVGTGARAGVRTRLDLYGADGRALCTLVDAALPAGSHAFSWNGRDARGQELPAGVYFARAARGAEQVAVKLHLIR